MKPFSRDWAFFTAGFIWAYAVGALSSLVLSCLVFGRGLDSTQELCEKPGPSPLVEMAEYRGVVHALEACGRRLDQKHEEVQDLQTAVSHWGYIDRLPEVDLLPEDEVRCEKIMHKAFQDIWFDSENALYDCLQARQEECWCLFDEGD